MTAVTFTARSVHSRVIRNKNLACDDSEFTALLCHPDTLPFRAPAAARARSLAIDILPAVARPSTATAPTRIRSQIQAWLLRHHSRATLARAMPFFAVVLVAVIVLVGAIAVVAVGAAEPSVVVDDIALVFRLPRFLYGHGYA